MYNVVTEQSSLEDIRKAFDELNHKMEELLKICKRKDEYHAHAAELRPVSASSRDVPTI